MVSRKIGERDLLDISTIKTGPQRQSYLRSSIKTVIIKEFDHFIDKLKETYQIESLIRELIDYDYKKAINKRIEAIKGTRRVIHYDLLNEDKIIKELKKKTDAKKIINTFIRTTGEEYNYFNMEELLRILKIVCDIKDFALGGTLKTIKKKNGTSHYFVNSIAQILFSDTPDLYMNRFYQLKYLNLDLLWLTKQVSHDQIEEQDFSNLENQQLQDLFNYYRHKKKIDFGSNLFRSVTIDFDFTSWLAKLSSDKLNVILEPHKNKLSSIELLMMCAEINRGLEILKYIVYSLIKSSISIEMISKISGKGITFIQNKANFIYKTKFYVNF